MKKENLRTGPVILCLASLFMLTGCSSFDMFFAREKACTDVAANEYGACIKDWREDRQRDTDMANAAMNENLDERAQDDAEQAERAILEGKDQ